MNVQRDMGVTVPKRPAITLISTNLSRCEFVTNAPVSNDLTSLQKSGGVCPYVPVSSSGKRFLGCESGAAPKMSRIPPEPFDIFLSLLQTWRNILPIPPVARRE